MQNRNRKIVKNEKIYMVLLMLMFTSGVEENISLKKKRVIIKMTPKILSQNPNPKKHLSPKA